MTFTVIAVSPRSGLMAVATASFSLAVGNAVPALVPGIGAVASQAYTNRRLRTYVLEALQTGGTPTEIVAGIGAHDPEPEYRQLGVAHPGGATAVHTGEACTPWSGEVLGAGFAVFGNYLVGPQVIDAMARAIDGCVEADDPPSRFAERVLAALGAGESAGGDRRGKQSAALLVGRTTGDGALPPELEIDLRVDDDPAPLEGLGRMLALAAEAATARTE